MVKVIFITNITKTNVIVRYNDTQSDLNDLMLQPGLTYVIHREHMAFYPLIIIECLDYLNKVSVYQKGILFNQLLTDNTNSISNFIREIDISTHLNAH